MPRSLIVILGATLAIAGCGGDDNGAGASLHDAGTADDASTGLPDSGAPIADAEAFDRAVPPATGARVLTGVVTDSQTDQRLSGVTVTAGASTVTTDANGQYAFSGLTAGRVVVSFAMPGYAPGYATATIGPQAATTIVALKQQGDTQSYDPTQAATLSQTTLNGPYAVIFTPGVLDTTDVALTVSVTPLDPTSEISVLPGTLATATAVLQPLTFAEFSIFDSMGNRVNLKSGAEATVELPIPISLRGVPDFAIGQTIHCYSYNPTSGNWEDFVVGTVATSSVDGTTPVLRASVKHFSWYGGAPEASTCVPFYGTVVSRLTRSPLANATVTSTPGTNATSDANGNFNVLVPTTGGYVPTISAYQTLVDVDGSLSGTPGASVIEFGEISTAGLLTGLTPVDCVTAQAADAGPARASGGGQPGSGPDEPVQVVISELQNLTYQVQFELALDDSGGATLLGSVTIELSDGTSNPATAAEVTLIAPNQTIAVPTLLAGTGAFELDLAPIAGGQYTLLIDADGNGTTDGQGSLILPGKVAFTNPAPGSSVSGTGLVASWSDTASSTPNYAAYYQVVLTSAEDAGTSDVATYLGTGRQFPATSAINPGGPLLPGPYTATIDIYGGAFALQTADGQAINNIRGPSATGTFWSLGTEVTSSFAVTP